MKTHKDLKVWKKSLDLVEKVYISTKAFPKEEIYGLSSQIRRAAISIPSNIAEGAARNSRREFVHFLYIAFGSINELETQFIIAERLGYCEIDTISEVIEEISKMLSSLIKHHKSAL